MKKTTFFVWLFTLFSAFSLQATHQRAGEISYSHVSGLTYEFTIITYTYTPSMADRPEIDVYWGDGSFSTIPRETKVNLENNISLNRYVARHTFPSSGNFPVTFEDPNRNAGIVNIPNSVNIPFFIETIININPFLGTNSSPVLLNPPIDNGCTQVPYYHNPGAYDPDGDSLSYSLVGCRGYEGEAIPGYAFPSTSGTFSISSSTGDLTWDSPVTAGEYNIAILIQEWRDGILMGSVLRDMQITIAPCDNQPPQIFTITDTCVIAGDTLSWDVTARDETSTLVTLSASGSPLELEHSPALFSQITAAPPLSARFIWNTDCRHVSIHPYTVLFKAKDNGPHVELSSYKTVTIRVIAPKPEGLAATPVGNTVELSWDPHVCEEVQEYDIYKRRGSHPFEPDYCETGLAPERGYTLIGSTQDRAQTAFIDDGAVMPLYHGNEYCYRVVAFFADRSESIVSEEVCVQLADDAPLMTRVDVEITDTAEGVIQVAWSNPPERDSLSFPGPYFEYHLWRAHAGNGPYEMIGSTSSLQDTSYQDLHLNTQELTYFYKVELWTLVDDSLVLVESSDPASSLFIETLPEDRTLTLSWNEAVPWNNERYTIYRYDLESGLFDSLATVTGRFYVDRGLVNGEEYCYYVRSEGRYFSPEWLHPLHNRSQIRCDAPYDNTPPELPAVNATTDCETVTLSWIFSNDTEHEDVYTYYIYYASSPGKPLSLIDSLPNDGNPCYPDSCFYLLDDESMVPGCFALSTADSNGNRSDTAPAVCLDYDLCFDYRLPNVFTPNQDGYNDQFHPFPYSHVEKVDMIIYDRWGRRVFTTEDPGIQWDGVNMFTGKKSPDGVYYYVCDVYVPTLEGRRIFQLIGSITVLR